MYRPTCTSINAVILKAGAVMMISFKTSSGWSVTVTSHVLLDKTDIFLF